MGYALRRRWLPQGVASLRWNQWQLCRGMRGNFAMESVASFAWNWWQLSRGIRTFALVSAIRAQDARTPACTFVGVDSPASQNLLPSVNTTSATATARSAV